MNKKALLIVATVLVVVSGSVAYVALSKDEMGDLAQTSNTSEASSKKEPSENVNEPVKSKSKGAYVDYSDSIIASTKGTKILFFHAPWCPQCLQLEDSILEGTIPSGVTFIKVDYDSSQDLRQKYGVTIQTTLVKIDDQGNELKKFVAYDEPSLESVKNALL